MIRINQSIPVKPQVTTDPKIVQSRRGGGTIAHTKNAISGALRLFLAILVVMSYFAGDAYYKHSGYYSVQVLILPGFAITAALNEVSAFDLKRLWTNRALRLLPLYDLVLVTTLAVILALPAGAARFTRDWATPSLHDIWLNLALLPMMDWRHAFRLVMPSWSIAVEILLYIYLAAGIARRKSDAYLLFAAAVAFHTLTVAGETIGMPATSIRIRPLSASPLVR